MSFIKSIKDLALKNLPFILSNGSKALDEGKKKVTEYSIKQKINANYKKIGQIIYTNKLKINNANIKKELEMIAGFYLDIKNNNDLIDTIKKNQ